MTLKGAFALVTLHEILHEILHETLQNRATDWRNGGPNLRQLGRNIKEA